MDRPGRASSSLGIASVISLATIACPVQASAAQLTLTWIDAATNELGVSIERSIGSTGVFSEITTTGPGIVTYVDTNLANTTIYCYRLRAFNEAGYSDYSNIACGATPVSTSFTDDFERADSTVLGLGWIEPQGDFFIAKNTLWNGTARTRHLAVQSSLTLGSGRVSAAFKSKNNNSAPAFGLVFGYVDVLNYYAAYRQVGGSSLLKIVRVANGVETVLAQRSSPNPVRDTTFSLTVTFSQSQIVLTSASLSVTAAGVSISPGQVGLMVVGGGKSHSIDNFQAGP